MASQGSPQRVVEAMTGGGYLRPFRENIPDRSPIQIFHNGKLKL